ncbi:hypothetical protein [Schinkia azotoformans]|uniref:hypothetical protein n=1 Tax=Schinkia azotoformans TaxID=1454 RepID=UPI002DBD027E|nr:hypothetical protein [Schinkia azotoformans]MEC1759900.1 hypothetical protein [Schinkia azotoformans]
MEKVIDVKEFKLISKQFRRVAGDLLNAQDTHEAMRLAKRFIMYIDNEPILSDFISKNNTVEYDIKDIIQSQGYNDKFAIPIKVNEEIAFIYQLIKYITENFDRYDTISRSYAVFRGAKIADGIREFNREVVKLLVNHITDYLEEKAIELGIDEKPNAKILVQGNVGQLNFTETGSIQANQTINPSNNEELLTIAKELIVLLKDARIENSADKEDAIDFVEEATNAIELGNSPKPSVIRRARESLNKIRTTVDDSTFLALQIDRIIQAFGNIPL